MINHQLKRKSQSAVQENDSRRAMLASIRERLAVSEPFDAVRSQHGAHHQVAPRGNHAVTTVQTPALTLTERFRRSLEAVSGKCVVVRDELEAGEAVLRIIEQRQVRRIAVSDSPLAQRVMGGVKTDAELLQAASTSKLFNSDASVTSAQRAIAETGTLVLESEKERHRLASLVPPVHIAIIEAGKIHQTMGEVLQLLGENGRDGLSPTVTFITGPSRTSDIELTLTIGVHGPAELHVVIIDEDAPQPAFH
jgi:L-lactate dehydrogenase complex protein LldG